MKNVEREGTKRGVFERQGNALLDKGREDPEATKNHPRKSKGHRSCAAVLHADCTRSTREPHVPRKELVLAEQG